MRLYGQRDPGGNDPPDDDPPDGDGPPDGGGGNPPPDDDGPRPAPYSDPRRVAEDLGLVPEDDEPEPPAFIPEPEPPTDDPDAPSSLDAGIMTGGEEELLSDDVRATDWGKRFPGQYETEHREDFLIAQGLDPDDPNVPSELGPDPVTGMDPQQFGQFVHRYKRELVREWPDDLDDNPANLRMDRPGGGRPLEADGVRFGADPENPDKHEIYELKPNTNPHAHERQEVLYPHYKQEQHGGTFDFKVVPYDPQELRQDMSEGRWPERPAPPPDLDPPPDDDPTDLP